MKILARIRQLLTDKDSDVASADEDFPLPVTLPTETNLRRRVERPSTPRTVPIARVAPRKAGFRLEGERNASPILNPSVDELAREVGRLRTSGPSFLILTAPDGSFMQAAGNAKRMTIEGHFITSDTTAHVVLGRRGASGVSTTIASTVGSIDVLANEVWAAPEAISLLSAFLATGAVPSDLNRRDISADIDSP